jgi:hypothetical protein
VRVALESPLRRGIAAPKSGKTLAQPSVSHTKYRKGCERRTLRETSHYLIRDLNLFRLIYLKLTLSPGGESPPVITSAYKARFACHRVRCKIRSAACWIERFTQLSSIFIPIQPNDGSDAALDGKRVTGLKEDSALCPAVWF